MFLKYAMMGFFLCASQLAFGLNLELTQGITALLPIAIASFGNQPLGESIREVIDHDLRVSGQFKLVSDTFSTVKGVSVSQYRNAGADTVLVGEINALGNNNFEVKVQLLDAQMHGRLLLSDHFQIQEKSARDLAHHISDIVYEKLTGEKGVFSTKIAYIVVRRLGGQSRYSLEVADMDGYNPRTLLVSSESIMSPAWSPNGRDLAYVSFEKKKAQIFVINVQTGRRQLITNFPGINGAPAWSPDGKQLAVVLSKAGSPKIYIVQLSTGEMKQLTFGDAIDTEPRFSPDGQSIIFTSGRGGSPQIYRLTLSDGHIVRLTYEGNYNASATETADKKHLVIMHRDENHYFHIAVFDNETQTLTEVTSGQSDESPSVSPNGRLIVYATQYQGKGILDIVSIDGHTEMRLPLSRDGDIQGPAWSPLL